MQDVAEWQAKVAGSLERQKACEEQDMR